MRFFWRRDIEGLPNSCIVHGVSRESVEKILAEERAYPHAIFGLASERMTLVANWNDLAAITVTETDDA